MSAAKKYVLKNGYYAASTWVEDTDGKWYYFDMSGYLVTNDTTPDGYRVDENGVWDGQATTIVEDITKYGPGGKAEPQKAAYLGSDRWWLEIYAGRWKLSDKRLGTKCRRRLVLSGSRWSDAYEPVNSRRLLCRREWSVEYKCRAI